ncbi:hypothetical protein ACQ4LE_006316 [Meloidogyne hapla]|uniref:Col_cuticle_N domain-containing protein n=1 Tax=Meloidogyne hapla TaxID=6305 RepID=A0A1I8BWC9_MELHA
MFNETFPASTNSTLFETTLITPPDSLIDICDNEIMKGLEIWLLALAIIPFCISLLTVAFLLVAINAVGKIEAHSVEADNRMVNVRLNATSKTCQQIVKNAFRAFALKNKELAKIA